MGFEFLGHLLAWVFNGLFIAYWLVTGYVLWRIARAKWQPWQRIALGLAAGGILIGWPVKQRMDLHAREQAARERYAAAEVRFNELCKGAGEKIYRTVDGVEGVMLMKVKQKRFNPYDQFADDPYGSGASGNEYIKSFLAQIKGYGEWYVDVDSSTFRFVDAIDPEDGQRYRYTGRMGIPPEDVGKRPKPIFLLEKTLVSDPPPRYGVTYEDISKPEDRQVWIAGSSLKVIDLQTHEVLAERVGYLMDKELGNKGAARAPWSYAHSKPGWSCPALDRSTSVPLPFVKKVLHIQQGYTK